MMRSKPLTEIAQGMLQAVQAKRTCWTQHTLGRGLWLVLSRDDTRFVLSLRREGVFPSEHEVAVCMRDFGVPEGTEPMRRQQTTPTAGRSIRWCIVDLRWRELATIDEQRMVTVS